MLIHPQEALLQQARALQQALPTTSIEHAEWWQSIGWRGWSSWESDSPATSVGSRRDSRCTWLPRSNLTPWCWAKSVCQAVPVAAQQATASSAMMSSLLSPMRRPISVLSSSDNYGL